MSKNPFGGIAEYSGPRGPCQTRAKLILRMSSSTTRGQFLNFTETRITFSAANIGNLPKHLAAGTRTSRATCQEPVNRIQRLEIAATVPHALHITSSQIALESEDDSGSQVRNVHQGINAPIANAWLSPRAKTAKINSGVGNTQYTTANSSVATNSPIFIERTIATATTVTQISIQPRLN